MGLTRERRGWRWQCWRSVASVSTRSSQTDVEGLKCGDATVSFIFATHRRHSVRRRCVSWVFARSRRYACCRMRVVLCAVRRESCLQSCEVARREERRFLRRRLAARRSSRADSIRRACQICIRVDRECQRDGGTRGMCDTSSAGLFASDALSEYLCTRLERLRRLRWYTCGESVASQGRASRYRSLSRAVSQRWILDVTRRWRLATIARCEVCARRSRFSVAWDCLCACLPEG